MKTLLFFEKSSFSPKSDCCKFFLTLAKKCGQRCQNCILSVQMKFFVKFFLRCDNYFFCFGTQQYLSEFGDKYSAELSKLHCPWEQFEKNTFLRVSQWYFSTPSSKNNFGISRKLSFTLSKLSSTSQQEQFQENSLKTFGLLFFRLWAKKFHFLDKNLKQICLSCNVPV